MKKLLALLIFVSLAALAAPKPPASGGGPLVLPMTGSKWSLYDLGAIDNCGVSTCGAGQVIGTLPSNGGVYFDLPVSPDVPAGIGTTGTATFVGTGLNDVSWIEESGLSNDFCVQVSQPNAYKDGAGWHDQLTWGAEGSCTNGGVTYIQSLSGVWLESGVLIVFSHYSGHALGDRWTLTRSGGSTATSNDDWRGYLVTVPSVKKLVTGQVLNMVLQVVTTGTPTFGYHSADDNTCVSPAAIRPYFQSGAFLSTTSSGGNRWWANPTSIVLADGTVSISIPLQPQYWSNTYGQQGSSSAAATKDFTTTIGVVGWIGATMGGGCFFGHGVNVNNGTARVVVKSYSVQ